MFSFISARISNLKSCLLNYTHKGVLQDYLFHKFRTFYLRLFFFLFYFLQKQTVMHFCFAALIVM